MKFVRFQLKGTDKISTGLLTDSRIKEITGDIFGYWILTETIYDEKEVILLSPVVPNQVIGIGANFVSTKEELPENLPDMPVFFFKPTSSVIGTGETIKLPNGVDKVKFESELAVIIGKEAKDLSESEVNDYIFGYTVANDVTAPEYFHPDGHWTIGKSFDSFTPLGPAIETNLDLKSIHVQSYLNDEKQQDGELGLMILSLQKMVSYLSTVMTLKPGDVILTGAPVGAGYLVEGDTIECRIEGIGSLKNQVSKTRRAAATV
ncbi:fumarylacetoacetate hydrolase family protein [Alkalihalobacillus sp. AL-G]|uniref:fumarylacetoacetate hydrolase family protein n=1 Tax=Alkalihalobacillus sp. AL-G TaxID=2926399 RepID=UPI00272AAEF5|nr:fumarylacetoacetate hydrolase family protein [Alkalihalobacillus sp. AL-G]WLD93579.1 fumarylacetoacetate hydrolase family protein [Alkalihalobacillus sp. AL-G]